MKVAGLSTSHVLKYGEYDFPASNNKAPYRGVASRPNSRVQWAKGGGGGGGGGERGA